MNFNKAEVVRHNWNELHCAARDGKIEVVKKILHEVLCGVDDRTPIDETALHKAVRGDRFEICKILLLQGADPNIRNKGGRTPLYFVRSADVAELLLQAGADTHIKSQFESMTPLDFIKERIHIENNPELESVIDHIETHTNEQIPLELKKCGEHKIEAYKAAIRHGTKPMRHLRLTLVGPERVGKTSLKNALLGYDFNIDEKKTNGIESSTTCRVDIEDISNWQREFIDPKYNVSQILSKEIADILKMNTLSEAANPHKTDVTSPPSSSPPEAVINNQDVSSLPKDINRLVDAYMNLSCDSLEEKCKLLFSVWDFAGHHLYYTVHQVFLSPRSIYVVVFDACKDLLAKADMDFLPVNSYQGIDQELTVNHEMTNLEFLNFWISSIFTHVSPNPNKDEDELLSPPVFIVGTHLDKIPGTNEEKQATVDRISMTIKDYLEDKAYIRHVVPEIYFVDNTLRPTGETIDRFKRHVENVMRKQPYMEQSLPIAWFRFQNYVIDHRKTCDYITFNQAKEVATSLGIENDQELYTMLQLFHDIGIIAFYGTQNGNTEALGDLVVLNPQWLLTVFTSVITITKREEKWTSFKWCWRILEEKGILEETLINHVWEDFSKDERECLLQIMQRFDLLCENIVKRDEADTLCTKTEFPRQFFVPCQLIPNKQDHGKVWESDLNSVVINIIPKDGFLPEGLFHRMSIRAVAWTQRREGCQLKPPRLFYRQTEMYLDEDHELIIKIHVTKIGKRMIKIIIYFPPIDGESNNLPTSSMCKEVLLFVENNLNDLKMMWMKNIVLGVFVPCYMCLVYDCHYHDLYTCLKTSKIECGRSRKSTKFWQNLFGVQENTDAIIHPLSEVKVRENQANATSLSVSTTSLLAVTKEAVGDAVLLGDSILQQPCKLITEMTHEENESSGKTVNVTGNENMVIINSRVNINMNHHRCILRQIYPNVVPFASLVAIVGIVIYFAL